MKKFMIDGFKFIKLNFFLWNQEKLFVKKIKKLFGMRFFVKFFKKFEYLLKRWNFLCFCVCEEYFNVFM